MKCEATNETSSFGYEHGGQCADDGEFYAISGAVLCFTHRAKHARLSAEVGPVETHRAIFSRNLPPVAAE